MKGFKYKKAIQALNHFATREGSRMNKMKALKLIWLSDRYHLRRYGRTITGDIYFALPFGPVASTTRDILEENTSLSDLELQYSNSFIEINDKYNYSSKSALEEKVFSKTDLEVLDIIYDTYNPLTQFELSELSHKFPEWEKYKSLLDKGIASRYGIDANDFFDNIDDGKGLFIDEEEFISVSKEIFAQKK